jgi:hypothetical protein
MTLFSASACASLTSVAPDRSWPLKVLALVFGDQSIKLLPPFVLPRIWFAATHTPSKDIDVASGPGPSPRDPEGRRKADRSNLFGLRFHDIRADVDGCITVEQMRSRTRGTKSGIVSVLARDSRRRLAPFAKAAVRQGRPQRRPSD